MATKTSNLMLTLLCSCVNVFFLLSCGEGEEYEMIGGTEHHIEDFQSIAISGGYIKDTSRVIGTYHYLKYIPYFDYILGEHGEWYCISFEPNWKALKKYNKNFEDISNPGDTFELEAKLHEYKVDSLIMKHRVDPMHWHWLEPQEGTKMYTVFTTEMKMWRINGDRKELVEF